MSIRRIGKLGRTTVEVRTTDTPWEGGFDNGIIVISAGFSNSLRGRFVQFWSDNLDKGKDVIRQIRQGLRSDNPVQPPQPAWLTISIPQFGINQLCNVCVATAFDPLGPDPDNARRATSAVIRGASQRKYTAVSLPLLGAGAGRLDPLKVFAQEVEGIALAQTDSHGLGIETISFIIEAKEFELVADFGGSYIQSRTGIAKWSDTLMKKGKFGRIHVLEELAGGYSGACLGVCEVWDEHQTRLPLSVFKVGPTRMIDQEKRLAKQAVKILKKYAVEVQESYQLSDGFSALRMPLVGDSDTARAGQSFLKFFAASGDPHEIATTLRTVFGYATRDLYADAEPEFSTAETLRQFMEKARANHYWSEASLGFKRIVGFSDTRDLNNASHVNLKRPVAATIENFFGHKSAITRLWDIPVEVSHCESIHGDLNPRNVVMIRAKDQSNHTPRIVDFHRFGQPGPLALDFARFEAGVQVKCIEEQIERTCELVEEQELLDYESFVNGGPTFIPWEGMSLVGVISPAFVKAVAAISAIRQCFTELSPVKNRRDYWWCLFLCLVSYLRPVYDGRLSDEQRSYAIYVASKVLSRHLLS
jgi:hypothetical protein